MRDLGTMLWKETAEFIGNRRFLRVFFIAVLIMGLLPEFQKHGIESSGGHGRGAVDILPMLDLAYALLASVIVVAQTAPDLVLRERSGGTLEYLLATRMPDGAIFGGKIILAAGVGYLSGLVTVAVQMIAANLGRGGPGWSWIYLALPQGRLIALLLTPLLAAYLATVGTFVALRVGDQRGAYLVTMLGVGVLALPFLLHLTAIRLTMSWLWRATGVLAVVVAAVVALGFRMFRREMLVLYLQE
jgi:ABC-type Na+ efflux pump permease subunit